MKVRKFRAISAPLLVLLLLVTGCAQPTPPPAAPVNAATSALTPFHTPLPSATLTPPGPGNPIPLPSPTPTPRTHTVARGETLGVIAFRYGVTVEALLAANPGINANAMSIGASLVIPPQAPGAVEPSGALPTIAPQAVVLGAVNCYRSQENAAWCFLLASNPGKKGLESLSVVVRMADANSGQMISNAAMPPLNLLPAGKQTALAAYFPAPVPDAFVVSAELLTALPQPADDSRYLPASVENLQVEIAPGGLSARLRGSVTVSGEQTARVIWLGATALTADGQPVGVRRYETGAAESTQSVDFDFSIYTSAGTIVTVDVLVEARP